MLSVFSQYTLFKPLSVLLYHAENGYLRSVFSKIPFGEGVGKFPPMEGIGDEMCKAKEKGRPCLKDERVPGPPRASLRSPPWLL